MKMQELRRLQEISHPVKARLLAFLLENPGADPGSLSQALEIPLSTVYKHLRDLSRQDLVQSKSEGRQSQWFPKDFDIRIRPNDLPRLIADRPDYMSLFEETYGQEVVNRSRELLQRAKSGKLTLRQAAGQSDLSYYEFMLLADSLGLKRP